MLTQEEKLDILREFPNVKLSYEKITHKKVYNSNNSLNIPIPGKKEEIEGKEGQEGKEGKEGNEKEGIQLLNQSVKDCCF
jgi:hypothetical protein